MDNTALKEEAEQLLLKCELPELLAGYPDWFIGGSYSSIKGAFWQRPEFRDTVTSDLIYRAVLENGGRTVSDFERFISENSQF